MNYFYVGIFKYPIQSLVYSYDGEIENGSRVFIDIRGRRHLGYVIEKAEKPEFDVKSILEVVDKTSYIDQKMMLLIKESAFKYMVPVGEVMDLCFPPFKFKGKSIKAEGAGKYVSLKVSLSELLKFKFTVEETKIVEFLLENGVGEYAYISRNFSKNAVKSLLDKGVLTLTNVSGQQIVNLTPVQRDVVMSILSNPSKPHLIHGITGSGKTEIYFDVADNVVKSGKKVLILVPEIILTPQLMVRTRKRFPNARVGMYHSALGSSRKIEWDEAVSGNLDILLGTRSAVWVPMKNIGLIVVDEEQDESYKQYAMRPYYNAVDVAKRRAEIEGSIFVLSSATPRIETYYRCMMGSYELHKVEERTVGEIPEITVVKTSGGIFSNLLISRIDQTIKKGNQVFLFVPKKGFASRVQCEDCGYIFKCPNCDVPMTYHKIDGTLKCHYCGHVEPLPVTCPICGSSKVRKGGIGTERVEHEIARLFPGARVKRMDREEIKDIESVESTLDGISKREYDIVVGTKMITKGLDFPSIGLVGVIDADHSLGMPDFRSNERTFQLLSQVSGRAGRGVRGEVVIQTMDPANPTIKAVEKQDYESFYLSEIERRRASGYPPFKELILITSENASQKEALENIERFKSLIANGPFEVLGPAESPIFKLMSKYRYQLLLKCDDIIAAVDYLSKVIRAETIGFDPANLKIDVGPYSF
ncbi:replication restart helicase PriA [Athalassotoga saccharophila]|uniref:replication restart helicase PriA n=1 Tax=Athalassotoga saccharophila TaxID=1441386 RepID=UPI0013795825|nr:primosomal protein N' [Athalassotoga saccharophila]BBJ28941.1 primosomal protein N' [Athalassotoga saccharophila]